MVKIKFLKMHGLGNDFVIIKNDDLPSKVSIKDLVIKMSDRHLGIGCDQFIILQMQPSLEMFIYNQDGSQANACGNATRCIAKMMQAEGIEQFNIKVAGRQIAVTSSADEYSVNMGIASFQESWMPSSEKLWEIAENYKLNAREMMCVDVGNPHLVIIRDNLTDEDKSIIGQRLEKHNLFPNGVNVNFAEIKNNKITLKVWERGAGFTYACGSGACASFAACNKLGFVGSEAVVNFALGSLKMKMRGEDVIMTGGANMVFAGEYYYE